MDNNINSRQKNKDSISVTVCVGSDIFQMLDDACEVTGQSKTAAVERAILAYCGKHARGAQP